MTELKASAIDGKEVVTEDGHVLGEVADWILDPASWQAVGIVVHLNRDVLEPLGLKKPMIGTHDIVVASNLVSGVAARLVLSVPLSHFVELGS